MENQQADNLHQDKKATGNRRILSAQKTLADWLNWNCRHLSGRTLMALLIVFSAISASYLLCLIIAAFN